MQGYVILEMIMLAETTEREKTLKVLTGSSSSALIVDYLPEPYSQVIVHYREYQCLAYLDLKGIWRSPFSGKPLEDRVLAWAEI